MILDIRENAKLVKHHYETNIDKKIGLPYFFIEYSSDPPKAFHEVWDFIDAPSRYLESLALIRKMLGISDKNSIEKKLEENLISFINADDNLFYRQKNSWSSYGAEFFEQSRALLAMEILFLENEDEKYLDLAKKCVESLIGISNHFILSNNKKYSYFPSASIANGYLDHGHGQSVDGAYFTGSNIEPIIKLYELTGDIKYLNFAIELTNYVLYISGIFQPDGSWPRRLAEVDDGHTHSRTATILGILKCGIALDDEKIIKFAIDSYEWGKTIGSSFGWMPELIGFEEKDIFSTNHSETCTSVDMINIACILAESVNIKYFDDIERFGVNYLINNQVLNNSIVKKPDKFFENTETETFKDIDKKLYGSFIGRSYPNDLFSDNGIWFPGGIYMACCGGAGGKGLYLLWNNSLSKEKSSIYINLYLSRISRELDILSFFPVKSKLEIIPKVDSMIYLRIPEWAKPEMYETRINGNKLNPDIENDYLKLGNNFKNKKIEISINKADFQRDEKICGSSYSTKWKGNYIIKITPDGRKIPMYKEPILNSDPTKIRNSFKII